MNDEAPHRLRAAKLLARYIELPGPRQPTPTQLLDPPTHISDLHWIWVGAYHPRLAKDQLENYGFNFIKFPRPRTRIHGKERHPVKLLMCLQIPTPTEEPSRIHRTCADARCVNPNHWRVVYGGEELRRKFP